VADAGAGGRRRRRDFRGCGAYLADWAINLIFS
jgi:hypothetical protein